VAYEAADTQLEEGRGLLEGKGRTGSDPRRQRPRQRVGEEHDVASG